MDELLKRYTTLKVNGLVFQVKVEDEGLVLDVFNEDEEVLESTYKFFHEIGIEEVKWSKAD